MAENFFDDAFSQKSGPSSKSKTRNEIRKKEEAASEKKKIKVLKEKLIEERAEREQLQNEMIALKARNKELEKECQDSSNKYLRLYEENDKLQEHIQEQQFHMKSKEKPASNKEDGLVQDLTDFFMSDSQHSELVRVNQQKHEKELARLR